MLGIIQPVFAESCLLVGNAESVSGVGPVSEFPRFEYSMRDVKRAGEVIAGALPWTDETAPKILEAFRIANNWRDAHSATCNYSRCN